MYDVPVTNTTTVSGSCGNDSQSITVHWEQKSLESKMMLQFALHANTSEFTLSEIYLSINAAGEFSDAKGKFVSSLNI